MKNAFRLTLMSAALAAFALPVFAQTTTTPATVTGGSIQDRKENQQDRIANGVKSGELTAGETTNLEKKESSLNQEERDMRKLDNGKLTSADKSTLNQQQNQLSKQIYQDKHNAAVQNTNPKSEVGKRQENQQDRIAQGVKSGQLTRRRNGAPGGQRGAASTTKYATTAPQRRQADSAGKAAGQPAAEPRVAPDLPRTSTTGADQ